MAQACAARGKRTYFSFDAAKFAAALLVLARHAVQWKFAPDTAVYKIVYLWLSNLAVPVFFTISGFLLFSRADKPCHLSWRALGAYLWRVLRLYLLWTLIYFPFSFYFWTQNGLLTFGEFARDYARKFFVTSNVIQLWYLPALMVACMLVFCLVKARVPAALVVLAALGCYAFGSLMGYQSLWSTLPGWALDFQDGYFPVFETTRNGFFYGFFFVALGMALTRARLRALKYPSLLLFAVFLALMLLEIEVLGENDMVFCAAPATASLFVFLRNVRLPSRETGKRLRAMSEWIYFAHALPLYALTALENAGVWALKPWPGAALACGTGLAVSLALWALSRTKGGNFLKKAI